MIVPDINLLIYAYDTDSPFHLKAASWWQACMSGKEPVLLPEVVAFGFVRVATNARAFRHPMTASEAACHVRSWMEQEILTIAEPAPDHVQRVLGLLESLGTAGNLVTDAQIAAITIEHDGVLHTADTDFIRFGGLRCLNPLSDEASARTRRPRRG